MNKLLTILEEFDRGPTDEQLASAPLLEAWWIIQAGNDLRACGDVSGHPAISEPFITTSPIIGFDETAGWMRTYSRFYRLGAKIDLPAMVIVGAVPTARAAEVLAVARTTARKKMAH